MFYLETAWIFTVPAGAFRKKSSEILFPVDPDNIFIQVYLLYYLLLYKRNQSLFFIYAVFNRPDNHYVIGACFYQVVYLAQDFILEVDHLQSLKLKPVILFCLELR